MDSYSTPILKTPKRENLSFANKLRKVVIECSDNEVPINNKSKEKEKEKEENEDIKRYEEFLAIRREKIKEYLTERLTDNKN